MRLPRVSLVGLYVMSCVGVLAGRQESRPQFRTGVELVQLDVTVLDNKREPVNGLSASDFTVLDNGVETPIRAFTPVELAGPARPRQSGPARSPPIASRTRQPGETGDCWSSCWTGRSRWNSIRHRKESRRDGGRVAWAKRSRSGDIHEERRHAGSRRSEFDGGSATIAARDQCDGSEHRISAEAEALLNQIPGFKIEPLNEPSCLCGLYLVKFDASAAWTDERPDTETQRGVKTAAPSWEIAELTELPDFNTEQRRDYEWVGGD